MPDDEITGLGVHMMRGETLKQLLWRVHEGEHPEEIFIELWANADHVQFPFNEEDEDAV